MIKYHLGMARIFIFKIMTVFSFSIFFFGSVLMGLNLLQFMNNVALRTFSYKKVKTLLSKEVRPLRSKRRIHVNNFIVREDFIQQTPQVMKILGLSFDKDG